MKVSKRIPSRSKITGFTLIEVLIVIGIFAVISIISYTALTQYINVNDKLRKNTIEIQMLQRAFTIMDRDLRYIIDRSVRNEYGDTEDAYLTNFSNGFPGELFRFTTIQPDLALPNFNQVLRVAWRIDNNELYRDSWTALDRDIDSEVRSQKLLSEVDSFEIEQFTWSDDFGLQQNNPFDGENNFPFGIKITIAMVDGKEYFRVYDIANGT